MKESNKPEVKFEAVNLTKKHHLEVLRINQF